MIFEGVKIITVRKIITGALRKIITARHPKNSDIKGFSKKSLRPLQLTYFWWFREDFIALVKSL